LSRGTQILSLDPLKTCSTTAPTLPCLVNLGRNCLAFEALFKEFWLKILIIIVFFFKKKKGKRMKKNL